MARTPFYADRFRPDFGIPWTPPLPPEKLGRLNDADLLRYVEARKHVTSEGETNPVGSGWTLPSWKMVFENWHKYNIHVMLGGNQCLRGDTLIYDPVKNTSERIDSIKSPHHVFAFDGQKQVIAEASEPFSKPAGYMLQVIFEGGSFIASDEHRVLTGKREWFFVWELRVGMTLLLLPNLTPVRIHGLISCGSHTKWDMTVPAHGNYVVDGVVHHNSAKTTLGARLSLSVCGGIPEAEVYAFHISEKRSIDDQQRFVYESLPNSLKNLPTKKGIHHSLQYAQKNGFTDGIMILPPHPGYQRGGSIKFYNYAQYQQNDQIIEGIKAHMIWLDEKAPLALFDTLKYRLFTYHGRILLTYTVIDGWNDTIEKILAKTKTLKTVWNDRMKMNLPIMQESLSMDSCAIYYAHTDDNPFTDPKEFWKLNQKEPREVILARAFGIPTKSVSSAFPLFSQQVNVIPHDKLPWLNLKKNKHGSEIPYPVTRYMAIDPGGSKNWFMLWVAIDASGTWFIYAEWPDFDDWALSGNKNGAATVSTGKGIKDYVELIKSIEGENHVFERIIDPRMGAAEKQSADGATTIISQLDEQGMTVIPAPAASSDANKGEIEDGIQLISDLLAYDTTKPIDSVNSPRLFVSDRCQNMIYALKEYSGKLGTTEATKDPIDALRYLRKASCEFIPDAGNGEDHGTGVY